MGAFVQTRRRKAAPLIAIVSALALAFALAAGCSQGEGGGAPAAETITVTCTIDGTEGGHGLIYDGTLELEQGSNVYDALLATEVDLSVKSSMGMGTYVAGIDGLMEKEQSNDSGWLYSINGEVASVGCDSYTLADGDAITWEWKLDALTNPRAQGQQSGEAAE